MIWSFTSDGATVWENEEGAEFDRVFENAEECESYRVFVLCRARHDLGNFSKFVDGEIFSAEISNPMDFGGLEMKARKWAKAQTGPVAIIVTGMTPALIAAINVLRETGTIKIVLFHFDRTSGQYKPQYIY